MKARIKEKLTSPVVWVTALGVILPLIALYNVEMSETVEKFAMAIITLASLFGILNNPNDKEGF